MLKLDQLFFINFFLIFIATLLISGFVTYFTLKDISLSQYRKNLENSIDILEINLNNSKNLEKLLKDLKKEREIRVTIIKVNGEVLLDNCSNPDEMDNHLHRPEIEALIESNSKFSHSIRFSKTVRVEFLYVAKKSSLNNKDIYIRMALDVDNVMDSFYMLWLKILLIFALSTMVALFIKLYINKKIKLEIYKITDFLHHLTNKNYKPEFEECFTEEFDSVYKLLKKVAKRLQKRDRQKKKFTQKLLFKNRQNQEIISAISHEFKNPVAVILGYSETLISDRDINSEIRTKFLQKISKNAERISKMIDRITFATKLENKDLSLKSSNFDIKSLIEDIVSLLLEKYRGRDIKLKGDYRVVYADKSLIELVIINLVENALKYSESEVIIEIDSEYISVVDFGIGVDREDIDKLTKKFYTVDKNVWNSSLGLGLNIVDYILKLHSSKLEIESEIDIGSKFSFKLK